MSSDKDTKQPIASPEVEQEAFLFDEFFETEENKSFPLTVKIAGRSVTIHIKKGLTNADRNAAEMAAIKTEPLPNGGMKILGMDESRLTDELIARAIVDWPFTNRDGSKVPINRETVRRLKGGSERIIMAVEAFDREGEAGLATFQESAAQTASRQEAE